MRKIFNAVVCGKLVESAVEGDGRGTNNREKNAREIGVGGGRGEKNCGGNGGTE